MKTSRSDRGSLYHAYLRVHLVDKCLIFIMLVLLVQSVYSLFFDPVSSDQSNPIDIIIRTSVAAIFGYFLSANFIREATVEGELPSVTPTPPITLIPTGATGLQSRIGFNTQEIATPTDPSPGAAFPAKSTAKNAFSSAGKLQILIAAGMGIFCLLALIFLRNMPGMMNHLAESSSAAATITQFRDIVSGCVGFLIGSPTTKNATNK